MRRLSARALQHRGNLGGMMPVVVDDEYPSWLAAHLEAAFGALELAQARRHAFEWHAQFDPYGNCCERVQQVVVARHVQFEPPQCGQRLGPVVRASRASLQCRRHRHRAQHDVTGSHVGRLGHAVRYDTSRHPAHQGSEMRVVCTADDGAVERHLVGKIDKRLAELVEAAVALQVFVVDVGNHCHRWKQFQERAIAFIRFRHHQFAAAEPRVAAERAQAPADHRRRIESGPFERQRDHRRRRRLAVRACHCDRVTESHQFGEHLGPGNHRNPAAVRFRHFRVARPDGRRHHHNVGSAHVVRRMSDVHHDADGLQRSVAGERFSSEPVTT
jgi:hypothetical protein